MGLSLFPKSHVKFFKNRGSEPNFGSYEALRSWAKFSCHGSVTFPTGKICDLWEYFIFCRFEVAVISFRIKRISLPHGAGHTVSTLLQKQAGKFRLSMICLSGQMSRNISLSEHFTGKLCLPSQFMGKIMLFIMIYYISWKIYPAVIVAGRIFLSVPDLLTPLLGIICLSCRDW